MFNSESVREIRSFRSCLPNSFSGAGRDPGKFYLGSRWVLDLVCVEVVCHTSLYLLRLRRNYFLLGLGAVKLLGPRYLPLVVTRAAPRLSSLRLSPLAVSELYPGIPTCLR